MRQKHTKNCASWHLIEAIVIYNYSQWDFTLIASLLLCMSFFLLYFAIVWSYFKLKTTEEADLLPHLCQILKDPEYKSFVILYPRKNLPMLKIYLSLFAPCCCSIYIFMNRAGPVSVSNRWDCFVGWALLDFYKKHVKAKFSSHSPKLYPGVFSFIFNVKSRILEVEQIVLHWVQSTVSAHFEFQK